MLKSEFLHQYAYDKFMLSLYIFSVIRKRSELSKCIWVKINEAVDLHKSYIISFKYKPQLTAFCDILNAQRHF